MAKQVGQEKVGRIECLVCGEHYWYNTTGHQQTHAPDDPQTYEEYKEYVAAQFGLDEDHELLQNDTVISPNKWYDARNEYPEVDIGLELQEGTL